MKLCDMVDLNYVMIAAHELGPLILIDRTLLKAISAAVPMEVRAERLADLDLTSPAAVLRGQRVQQANAVLDCMIMALHSEFYPEEIVLTATWESLDEWSEWLSQTPLDGAS